MNNSFEKTQTHWDQLAPEDFFPSHKKTVFEETSFIRDEEEAVEILIKEMFQCEAIIDKDVIWESLMFLAKRLKIEEDIYLNKNLEGEYSYKYRPDDVSVVSQQHFTAYKNKLDNRNQDLKGFMIRHLNTVKKEIYGEGELDKTILDFALTNMSWGLDQPNDKFRKINIQRKN